MQLSPKILDTNLVIYTVFIFNRYPPKREPRVQRAGQLSCVGGEKAFERMFLQ